MARATQKERIVAHGAPMAFTFHQDKVADSQTAVAMNLLETSTSRPKVTLVAGGSAGDHTVTGIATTDTIIWVGHLSTAAAIATLADLTGEFTITAADTINNAAGTDTTSDQLMVIWDDADLTVNTHAVTGIPIPYEFEVVGIAVESSDARTAGTLTADATINGTVTGLQAVLNATNTTRDTTSQPRGKDVGAIGDRIGVKLTTASWTPVAADITVTVFVIVHLEGY